MKNLEILLRKTDDKSKKKKQKKSTAHLFSTNAVLYFRHNKHLFRKFHIFLGFFFGKISIKNFLKKGILSMEKSSISTERTVCSFEYKVRF